MILISVSHYYESGWTQCRQLRVTECLKPCPSYSRLDGVPRLAGSMVDSQSTVGIPTQVAHSQVLTKIKQRARRTCIQSPYRTPFIKLVTTNDLFARNN